MEMLQNHFSENPVLDAGRTTRIAAGLKMTTQQVRNWFQNRRARGKLLTNLEQANKYVDMFNDAKTEKEELVSELKRSSREIEELRTKFSSTEEDLWKMKSAILSMQYTADYTG